LALVLFPDFHDRHLNLLSLFYSPLQNPIPILNFPLSFLFFLYKNKNKERTKRKEREEKMKRLVADDRILPLGHVRVGTEVITDPAYLVTRSNQDFISWVDSSKIKRHVMKYRDEVDDFDLL
jgi:hypothetical protein